jgi:prepilin-type N-terminal cleavage/methylation domain-containing protein
MTRPHGFTLIELAIVLVIITILVGGLAVPLSAQIQARRVAETNKTLEEAKEAIIGYAISKNTPPASSTCTCQYKFDGASYVFNAVDAPADNSDDPDSTCPQTLCPASSSTVATLTVPITNHYLPCPDLTQADPQPGIDNDGVVGLADMNNGVEDRMGPFPNINGACSSTFGNFPWATLGVGAQDAWGNRLRYSVAVDTTAAALNSYGDGTQGFFRSSKGDNQVCATSTGGCPSGAVAQDVAAVVLSHGPNGFGGRTVYGVLLGSPTSADETENADNDNVFITHPPTSAAGSEFDDQVIWISHDLLMSRVCPSGGCP